MAGSLQKSTEVMQTMHNLIKVPEVAATMRDLSKEMMKVCNQRNIGKIHISLIIDFYNRQESLKKC